MDKILLVFVGGGLGAIGREGLMAAVPAGFHGFPLDILAANLIACVLLGSAVALSARGKLRGATYLFIGTGVMGGLSTFSSFAYGAVVLAGDPKAGIAIAAVYVVISIAVGYAAILIGQRLGGRPQAHPRR